MKPTRDIVPPRRSAKRISKNKQHASPTPLPWTLRVEEKKEISASRKARPWAFLTPDLLLDVSGRLHDAGDFVRFHAICTSWRDLHSTTTRPKFLPWILRQCNGQIRHSPVIYSKRQDSSSQVTPSYNGNSNDVIVAPSADDPSWVSSADGTAAWLFTGSRPQPRLVDLVTGAVMHVPSFPDNKIKRGMRNPHGVVYGDGTIFLCAFTKRYNLDHFYTAAILRPGDAAWTVTEDWFFEDRWASTAYHDGKILVSPTLYSWCVLTLDFQGNGNDETTDVNEVEVLPDKREDNRPYQRYRCYVLESHGELLRVSVLIRSDYYHGNRDNLSSAVSVTVHALEEAEGNKKRWVARDGSSFVDRVFFLGFQASFSADAAQLGISGGSAYFVFKDRVLRCSLVFDGEAEFIKELPHPTRDAADHTHVWLRPQPAIAPIQKIRERLENQKLI